MRENPRGAAVGPLTVSQRSARLAARRRQVRRRQAVALGVIVLLIVAVVVAVMPSGHPIFQQSAAPPEPQAGSAQPVAPAKPVVHTPHPTQPSSSVQAAPVNRVLHYTSYVQLAGHRHREVALTFDDGPSPYTPQVLRVLAQMHAPATFFLIGRSASAYPQFVAAEVAAGQEVGNHTETHPPLGQLSSSGQATQLQEASAAIKRAGAPSPVLMRPPYGSLDAATVNVLKAQGLLMVLWSVDTKDYSRPGVSRIIYTAVSGGEPGAIVLMHDGGGDRSETVAALPRIITRLRQRGFRLVTISQLMADDPPPKNQPPPHSLAGF
ncbi:MAG TPA: polysaccharide deacetylase family protein [Solirubrobacteraceae bacterium]|nr:polysaccharide deacetylase family protein [Solirubrobacteraceae bacterium]